MKHSDRIFCLIATLGGGIDTAAAAQDYADVLGATPVYRQIQVAAPENRCTQQRVVDSSAGDADVAAGTLLGGVAGGVLGNTVGRGAGRGLATVVGAVAGAAVGNQIASSGSPPPSEHVEEQCQ